MAIALPAEKRMLSPSQSAPVSKPAPRAPIRLRDAAFTDYPQIADLEERRGLGKRSYEAWSHLWTRNPAFFELSGNWTIGWVAEDRDHRIVASLANIPLWYELEGRKILATTGKGLVCENGIGSVGLLLLDRLINHTQVELYVNNTVPPATQPIVEQFECLRVPVGVWDTAAFWIADYREFFEVYLRGRRISPARVLSYPVAAAARLRDAFFARKRQAEGKVAICQSFDERFDVFWDELRQKQPNILLAVRSREVLDWHFAYAALEKRLWIATISDGRRLNTYAVFERRDPGDQYSGLKRVRLVDFQTSGEIRVALPAVLDWAFDRCRSEEIHLLEVPGLWLEKGEIVDSIAPYRRKMPSWIYYYRAHSARLAERLKDRSAWFPTLYDGDATL